MPDLLKRYSDTIRQTLILLLLTLALLLLSFSGDESRRPLTLTGEALHRNAGSVDGTAATINMDSGYAGQWLATDNFLLNKGTYRVGVEYNTDTATHTLSVYDNGKTTVLAALPQDTTYAEFAFTLKKDSQDIVLSIDYSGQGAVSVYSLTLYPETRFYTDACFYAALILLLCICFLLAGRLSVVRALDTSSKAVAFALVLIALVAFLPYANSYLGFGDDICYHLIRIEGIKDGLADGQFPVVIYPEGVQGNGYLNCMYPNLFLYIPAILRLLNVSMATSYKFLVFLFQLLTPALTYYSVKSVCGDKKAALLAALLYTLCPYRLTNFYARGAVGEALAMTFFPLLFAGLYHVLLGDPKKYPLLVFGFSGLVQTHVLSSLLGAIFCVLLGILCLRQFFADKRWLYILKAALLTLFLNLWFLVPFLHFYLGGTLHTSALDWATFSEYSLNLSGLFGAVGADNLRVLSLGLPIGFCIAVSLFYFLLERKTAAPVTFFSGFLLVMGLLCTFMVINQFPAWEFMRIDLYDKFLKNIQFAWRMLSPASVTLVFAGCILLYRSDLLAPCRRGIFIALTAVSLLSAVHYQSENYAYRDYDSTYTIGHASKINGIPKGANTIVYPYEWMPADFPGAMRITEPVFTRPEALSDVFYGRTGTTTTLFYRNAAPDGTVILPLAAYDVYQATDENGTLLPLIENTDKLIEIALPYSDNNTHTITVAYKAPASFTLSFLLSVLAALLWAGYALFQGRKKNKPEP